MSSSSKYRFLVVDDVQEELLNTMAAIKGGGHSALGAKSLGDALSILKTEQIDVLLTDMHLNGDENQDSMKPEGLTLLQDVQTLHPEVLPLAMSKDIKKSMWDRALAYGALNFVKKPVDTFDDILVNLSLAKSRKSIKVANNKLKNPLPGYIKEKHPDGVIFSDDERKMVKMVASQPDAALTVIGETGTGKEEIAKLLHRERCIREGDIPLMTVNCSHLRSDLAHARLFGYRKGAFTGASETTNGVIAEANGGILFLDEFHLLPSECQADLLRVLNDGSYSRLGETKILHSHFQLVIACPITMEELLERGEISLDLVSRVMGMTIQLLPLRERKQDIENLLEIWFARKGKPIQTSQIKEITKKCKTFYWQGNIRLLFQALHMLTMQADIAGEPYSAKFLPNLPLMNQPSSSSRGNSSLDALVGMVMEGNLTLDEATKLFEKKVIQEASKQTKSIGDLVELLGTTRSTLDNKRKKLQINLG